MGSRRDWPQRLASECVGESGGQHRLECRRGGAFSRESQSSGGVLGGRNSGTPGARERVSQATERGGKTQAGQHGGGAGLVPIDGVLSRGRTPGVSYAENGYRD